MKHEHCNTAGGDPERRPDMEAAVAAIASNITTLPAVLAVFGASYDSVTCWTSGPDRKRWGRARELLCAGWDDGAIMRDACVALRDVSDYLLELAERFRGSRTGPFAAVVVALSHFATVRHVAERRRRELEARAAAATAQATDAGESAGGGNKAA